MEAFLHSPTLWYANRATGVVLVGLLTMSTAIGIVSTVRAGSARWPRFLTQALHRNVSLLALAMLVIHLTTAVIDTYVTIDWVDAVVPFVTDWDNKHDSRLWLGLGTVSFDLILAVVVTSLLRHRFNHLRWRLVHLMSYLAWGIGVLHGIGLGTDSSTVWETAVNVLSIGIVAAFALLRVGTLVHERRLGV